MIRIEILRLQSRTPKRKNILDHFQMRKKRSLTSNKLSIANFIVILYSHVSFLYRLG